MHYIAAVLPYQDPVTDQFTVAQLRDPQISKRVGGVSTFYIPPKGRKESNADISRELGLIPDPLGSSRPDKFPSNQWEPKQRQTLAAYSEKAVAAIDELEAHVVPEQYQPLKTSKAMSDIMTQLALEPKVLAKYKADPSRFAHSVPDLTSQEREALEVGDYWGLRCAMKNMPNSVLEVVDCDSSAAIPHPFYVVEI